MGKYYEHSADTKARISAKMVGVRKSQETRARMATTKSIGPREGQEAEWDKTYSAKLQRIRAVDDALGKLVLAG